MGSRAQCINLPLLPPQDIEPMQTRASKTWGNRRIAHLLAGVPAPSDDGDTSDLEELHLVRRAVVLVGEVCWLLPSAGESGIGGLFSRTKFRVVWAVENLGQVGGITCRYFPGCHQMAAEVKLLKVHKDCLPHHQLIGWDGSAQSAELRRD